MYFVIWGGWLAILLWGSIMALRGKRNWATLLLVTGSGCLVAGVISVSGGMFMTYSAIAGSGGGGSSSMTAGMAVAVVSGILVLLGILAFTAGFVGLCVRYGATEQRAEELELLVVQLQERIQSEG